MMVRRGLLVAFVALALAACAGGGTPKDEAGRALERLSVVTRSGEHQFLVEIADDDAERQRGLMFRDVLPDDRGMLFQFQDVRDRAFWMHNTPHPLDIIYIAPDGRIVSIAANAPANSDATIPSNGPASGVLELRAGRAAEMGATAGDLVKHPFFGNAD
ncbi:MAG TPA: DUF192 domain-containing protein [Novosphingobium sp.]|nr:DUF192 domain-containing protein [Novosphingobium sp.]